MTDSHPQQCLIQAEGRRGYCKLKIRGKISDELVMYASEIYQDPTAENCTWTFQQPRTFIFNLKDTKSAQMQASKVKNNTTVGGEASSKDKTFGSIYIKFESILNCGFSTEVSFPEEDDWQRRKANAERANESVLGRNVPKEKEPDEEEEQKNSLVAATQFKKKMAREIRGMVDDKFAAKDFLDNVHNIKYDRKRRNLHEMITNSTNPDKEEVDYIRHNIDDFYSKDNREEQKQIAKII